MIAALHHALNRRHAYPWRCCRECRTYRIAQHNYARREIRRIRMARSAAASHPEVLAW